MKAATSQLRSNCCAPHWRGGAWCAACAAEGGV